MPIDVSFLNMINESNRYLIDYANLKSNFLYPQVSFFEKNEYELYKKNIFLGVPTLLPSSLDCFKYNKNIYQFSLSKKNVSELIFSSKKLDYIGIKRTLKNGKNFVQDASPKKKYMPLIEKIIKFNTTQKNKILNLKKKNKKICAFQTRNYPHLGHEAIINYLLSKCNIVVINPILGPKKKGDVNYLNLIKSYNYLINNKFGKRVKFIPIIANMHYAGPREACHHVIIRKNFGFTDFLIGRDHAGAENNYRPLDAANICRKYINNLDMNIITINGAYFCKKCNKTVILNECTHSKKNMINISGSDFRNCLTKNKIYEFADVNFQKYLFKYIKNF
jgi:sulfate adenylyltransferase